MNSKQKYDALQAELAAIEQATGLYLADANVDRENVEGDDRTNAFWSAMIGAAEQAAGMRAEAAGENINKLIGRVIY